MNYLLVRRESIASSRQLEEDAKLFLHRKGENKLNSFLYVFMRVYIFVHLFFQIAK